MNRLSTRAVAAFLCTGLTAFAQAPAVKAVLLDDLSIVEGTFEEFNGVLRVTPATGSAKLLTPKQIALVADSRDKVYDFVAGKVDTTKADGSQKLAAWCEKVGMTERALIHAKAAAALAPADATIRETVTRLEKAVAAKLPADAAVKTSLSKTPGAAKGPAQAPGLPADAGIAFAAKVQPILMNQCGTCHAQKNYAGPFKLTRTAEGYASTEANADNLKATAAQLNRETPASSPLLTYALTAHGGQKLASFSDRQRPAFQHLETWVVAVLPTTTTKGFMAAPQTKTPTADADPVGLPGAIVGTSGQPVVTKPLTPPSAPSPPPAAPRKNVSRDPFDPQPFNSLPRKAEK